MPVSSLFCEINCFNTSAIGLSSLNRLAIVIL
jgi:hypothetical protein